MGPTVFVCLYSQVTPPPRGFAVVGAANCGNITGANGQAASCYRRLAPPAEPFQCPLPPPPSGLAVLLAGSAGSGAQMDQWALAAAAGPSARANLSSSWSTSLLLAPNDRNFPAGGLAALPAAAQGEGGRAAPGAVPGSCGLADADAEGLLTGIYGSAVGCLNTYDGMVEPGARLAMASTTIDRPSYGYPGLYNFFDPDNFLTLSAVLGAADPFLDEQVRRVLEQSGASLSASGELPHHFEGSSPVYAALSGEIMPGPNAFWLRTCLRYAAYSADIAWLRRYLPTLRHGLAYLQGMVNNSACLSNFLRVKMHASC